MAARDDDDHDGEDGCFMAIALEWTDGYPLPRYLALLLVDSWIAFLGAAAAATFLVLRAIVTFFPPVLYHIVFYHAFRRNGMLNSTGMVTFSCLLPKTAVVLVWY